MRAGLALVLTLLCAGCAGPEPFPDPSPRESMRLLVEELASYARERTPAFAIVPQNGHELVTLDGEPEGPPAGRYLAAISGLGREDLHYGYAGDDERTPVAIRSRIEAFVDVAKARGATVLVTDYAETRTHVEDAYAKSAASGYLGFVADSRGLDRVPAFPGSPPGANVRDVARLDEAANFLYLLDPSGFVERGNLLDALRAAPHDVLVIDAFPFGTMLGAEDVRGLQVKPGGGARLVLAYMSIGEAEEYRDYWQEGWRAGAPAFLAEENPDWPGNHKVRYWDPAWKDVLRGSPEAYLDRLLAAGFDGAYLDVVDAFERFETSG